MLTPPEVLEMHDALKRGASSRALAARFGVSRTVVQRIGTGQHWAWLTGVEPRPQWIELRRALRRTEYGDGRRTKQIDKR